MSDLPQKTAPTLESHTFAQRNSKTGLIEIVDMYTGHVVAVQREPLELLGGHRELFAEHVLLTGEKVLIQAGIDPGALLSTGGSPFSQVKVDLICQMVAEGGSLTKICKLDGMPTYTTLARWRRLHTHINEQIAQAKTDRAEYFRDAAVAEADEAESTRDPINAHSLRVDTYKWAAGVDDPGKYSPKSKIEATLNMPTQIIVATGIDRGPLERLVNEEGSGPNINEGDSDGAARAAAHLLSPTGDHQPESFHPNQEPGRDMDTLKGPPGDTGEGPLPQGGGEISDGG